MLAELRLVEAPDILWRVERATTALRFSRISPVDASATHAFLAREAGDVLRALGLGKLDIGLVRGPSRMLTRALPHVS